jgi:signal transduction histidine kinase
MFSIRRLFRLLAHVRAPFDQETTADERVLADIRVLFVTVLLLAIYLDVTEARHYVGLTYVLLCAYEIYSWGVFAAVRVGAPFGRRQVLAIHAVDVLAAASLTLLIQGPTSPLFVLFGFTLLAAGYRWGLWETLWTGVITTALYGAETLLVMTTASRGGFLDSEFTLNSFIIPFVYLLLFAVMIGHLAERRKASRAELADFATAAERARLARELHDGVIQSLLGVKMHLEMLRLSGPASSRAMIELQGSENLVAREVVNLRTMMFELAPIGERPKELPALLHDLVERFQHASGIKTRFVSAGEIRNASSRGRHEIARIVQESLVNIYKHSGGARNVLVSLSAKNDQWELIVNDDGRGFDFEGRLTHEVLDRERKGPRIIKERVRLLGGSLTIESSPGSGSQLAITLPVRV